MERTWNIRQHLRHLSENDWLPMKGPEGNILKGIEGKVGVAGRKMDGTWIGCDFIRMQPGSRFQLHVHEGHHIIYVISGFGFMHINGEDIAITEYEMIYVPAEYPHGMWVSEKATSPLLFIAMGSPHQPVFTRIRSRSVTGTSPFLPEK